MYCLCITYVLPMYFVMFLMKTTNNMLQRHIFLTNQSSKLWTNAKVSKKNLIRLKKNEKKLCY